MILDDNIQFLNGEIVDIDIFIDEKKDWYSKGSSISKCNDGNLKYKLSIRRPEWNGTKSCRDKLKNYCSEVIELALAYGCKNIAIPLFYSGANNDKKIAEIEFKTISNILIKMFKEEDYRYKKIEKIYFIVRGRREKKQLDKVISKYKNAIESSEKISYVGLYESIKEYFKEIKVNDEDKREYFGITRFSRCILVICEFFSLSNIIIHFYNMINPTWKAKRKLIERISLLKLGIVLFFSY